MLFPDGSRVYPRNRRIPNEKAQSRSRLTSAALWAHPETGFDRPPARRLKQAIRKRHAKYEGLASRLMKSWIIPNSSQGCEVSAIASKSLDIRLPQPNRVEARLTTQRPDKTSKLLVPGGRPELGTPKITLILSRSASVRGPPCAAGQGACARDKAIQSRQTPHRSNSLNIACGFIGAVLYAGPWACKRLRSVPAAEMARTKSGSSVQKMMYTHEIG